MHDESLGAHDTEDDDGSDVNVDVARLVADVEFRKS
jgi:hypothetical protein